MIDSCTGGRSLFGDWHLLIKERMVDLVKQVTELREQVTKNNESTRLAFVKMQADIDRLKKSTWDSERWFVCCAWIITMFALSVAAAADGLRKKK